MLILCLPDPIFLRQGKVVLCSIFRNTLDGVRKKQQQWGQVDTEHSIVGC